MSKRNEVPVELLHQLFCLDTETGVLTRKRSFGNVKAGAAVGKPDAYGYLRVMIYEKWYMAHRIVFAMHHGRWPTDELDHRNNIRHDNRPSNLREATRAENMRNIGARKGNKSGVKGVDLRACGRYRAQIIDRNGRHRQVGLYATLDEARVAYNQAIVEEHGDFARVQLPPLPCF